MDDVQVKNNRVELYPIAQFYLKQLQFYELLAKYLDVSKERLNVVSEALCLLVTNIIVAPKPLYKVEEWLSEYVDGLGEEPAHAKRFNDDCLGRALDDLFDVDRGSLGAELSAHAIRVHDLETSNIHYDTTSVTLLGEYRGADPQTVQLTQGYNKDHRPDCKQIVFGINTTEDGQVPLLCPLFDGNTADDRTHITNWTRLRELLKKEDFVYVADCKLCSEENLRFIAGKGGRFITIVPKNRREVKEFYQILKARDIPWTAAYEVENPRKGGETITYKTYEGSPTRGGFRMIWVHSSSKEKQDRSRRNALLHNASKQLETLSSKLNSRNLKTRQQIQKKVDAISHPVPGLLSIQMEEEITRKRVQVRPGRPSPGTAYKTVEHRQYRLTWSVNDKAVQEASRLDGVFPLVTNSTLSACEVLQTYKKQPLLEKRIYATKSILEVTPVFLKTPRRIEAMLFLYFVALMVITLVERNLCKQMAKEKIAQLPILPQSMNTKKPTWNNLRYLFRNVHLSVLSSHGKTPRLILKGMTDLHARIIRMLGLPDRTYQTLTENWWRFGPLRAMPP